MIIRRCSQGHRVRVHKNTTPGATRTKTYTDGSTETLAYPSSYDYFVDVDGEVAKNGLLKFFGIVNPRINAAPIAISE